jgi:hypothetical protein
VSTINFDKNFQRTMEFINRAQGRKSEIFKGSSKDAGGGGRGRGGGGGGVGLGLGVGGGG